MDAWALICRQLAELQRDIRLSKWYAVGRGTQ